MMVGSVCLTSKVILKNVLFFSNLSCNLLSVSQLCDDLQCVVQFNNSIYVIQRRMKEHIGMGSRKDGLYYFVGNNSIQHVSVSSDSSLFDLWHQHLGHPSENIVKITSSSLQS